MFILVPIDGTNEMSLQSRADVTLAVVLEPDGRGLLLEAIDAIEAVEAREVIELAIVRLAIVRLAAVRRTGADLERLRALLEGMRQCRDEPVAFAEFDFALHVTLSDAACNTLLASSLSALHEGMREMIARFARTAVAENRMDALVDSHVRLVEAVGRRDADEAALIVSGMMSLLRIESGRCRPRTTHHAIRRQVPQIGMLENTSKEKGDQP